MTLSLDQAIDLDSRYHIQTYGRKPVLFVRGAGTRLYDDQGREYIDFLAGIGVINAGHSHPAVVEAIKVQSERLTHVSNLFYVEHQGRLAETIARLVGGGSRKVFFANSGAEANEGAIKLARRWGKTQNGPACTDVVTARNSFHGRTLATLAATGQPAKHVSFEPLPQGFRHVELNDIEALDEALTNETCALMLEPIQGEGGVNPCEPGYLEAAERMCRDRGVLLVLDEVQSGCFRTGLAFAHHASGVVPDIVTMAKAMANGLPMGALVASDEVASVFTLGDHATTFGGGPVICAAAGATLAVLEEDSLGENAIAMGEYLTSGLVDLGEKTGAIAEVRGVGLMIGVQLEDECAPKIVSDALSSGLVINNIGDSILRFLPPLVCNRSDIDAVLGILEALLDG